MYYILCTNIHYYSNMDLTECEFTWMCHRRCEFSSLRCALRGSGRGLSRRPPHSNRSSLPCLQLLEWKRTWNLANTTPAKWPSVNRDSGFSRRHERQIPPGGSRRSSAPAERRDAQRSERAGWGWDDADALGRAPRQPGRAQTAGGARVSDAWIIYVECIYF